MQRSMATRAQGMAQRDESQWHCCILPDAYTLWFIIRRTVWRRLSQVWVYLVIWVQMHLQFRGSRTLVDLWWFKIYDLFMPLHVQRLWHEDIVLPAGLLDVFASKSCSESQIFLPAEPWLWPWQWIHRRESGTQTLQTLERLDLDWICYKLFNTLTHLSQSECTYYSSMTEYIEYLCFQMFFHREVHPTSASLNQLGRGDFSRCHGMVHLEDPQRPDRRADMRAGSKGSNHIPNEKVHREGDQHPPSKAAGGICYLDIILRYLGLKWFGRLTPKDCLVVGISLHDGGVL